MKNGNLQVNVEPVAWNLLNNKTTREQARIRDEQNRIDGIPIWIIANLKRHDTCFVEHFKYDLNKISELVGFKVCISRCSTTTGYVLFKEGVR